MDELKPTPIALSNEELTGPEFEALYRNAKDATSTKGRLARSPRAIPLDGSDGSRRLISEVTGLICATMRERGVTRAQLASKLGKSRPHISQLLDGRSNMTLATISDVMLALDSSLEVAAKPIVGP